MHLPEILILLGASSLGLTHLLVTTRWLRDETESTPAARVPAAVPAPAAIGMPGRRMAKL